MDSYAVRRLALVLAVQAEIDGMKAENAMCAVSNQSPIYWAARFDEKAEQLRNLSYVHDEQLF